MFASNAESKSQKLSGPFELSRVGWDGDEKCGGDGTEAGPQASPESGRHADGVSPTQPKLGTRRQSGRKLSGRFSADSRLVSGDRTGNRYEMALESVSRSNFDRFMEHFSSRGRW